jgi:type VI secretion system secreted protein Hcp
MSRSAKAKSVSRSLITRPLLAGAVALTALSAANAQAAAVDIFLKIDGIDGESQDSKHKGEIVISAFSDAFSLATVATARVGKSTCGPIQVDKQLDTSSMPLVSALMTGKVLPTATFTFRKSGGKSAQEFYVVTLTQATVTAFAQSANVDAVPSESLEFLPRFIQMKYTPQNPDGSPGKAVIANLDCTGGSKS